MVLQVDSTSVAGVLQGKDSGSMMGRSLIARIKERMHEFTAVWVCHIYKEANGCADILAGLGCDHEVGYKVYDHAPGCLHLALLSDCIGVSTPRRIVL